MIATLWDGNKRLEGQLTLGSKCLSFEMDDFHTSALKLSIDYNQIQEVKYYKLYDAEINGVEIRHDESRRSIFILEYPRELMGELMKKLGN